jgi:hypothetical protein
MFASLPKPGTADTPMMIKMNRAMTIPRSTILAIAALRRNCA